MTTSRQYVTFACLCMFSTALLWRPFIGTLALALRDDELTHILLILPVSAALVCAEWNSLKFMLSWDLRTGPCLAVLGVLIALAARLWLPATPDVHLSVSILGLVTLWIGTFVLCFGARAACSLLFPLCFLFWMVPIPSFALVRIVQWLQQGSAFAAWVLFSAADVPTSREGIFLFMPGLDIEVARECSSIRSSLMLLVTTMVLAHVLLRTPWRKALVILLAMPLSVAKNGVRIFTIGMLGTRIDRSFLTGRLHHDGGIVFFLITLGTILLVLWFLRRSEGAVASLSRLSPARSRVAPRSPTVEPVIVHNRTNLCGNADASAVGQHIP